MARKKLVRDSQSDNVREFVPPMCPPIKGVGFLPYQREEHGGPHLHWVVVRQSVSCGMSVAGPFHDRAAAAEFVYDERNNAHFEKCWIEHLYVPREHIEHDDDE